ncbi:MAG TPA: prepilin peptidase [Candidatus Doudnabacteria bacterium]|nr:prepilin peptidase [Candidatus Doudnabacteria bacterium]
MNFELLTTGLVFVFGTAIGSFLNVLIWRLPREQSVSIGRSRCTKCKHNLFARDLIPLLSYLISAGRCRYCNQQIAWRYPVIELVTGSLFAVSYWLLLPQDWLMWLVLAKTCFIIAVLVAVFVIDFEHYLILDRVVLPATILIFLANFGFDWLFQNQLSNGLAVAGLLGAVAGFLPFYLLWRLSAGRWMGFGDAKLGLFLGASLGFPLVWLSYLLAFFIGTITAIPLIIFGKKQLSSHLPFGTFLALSAVVVLWFGPELISWYFHLIGVR